MKRVLLHIAYWLGYYAFCVLIEYLWVKGAVQDLSESELLQGAVIAPFFISVPEVLFAYYLMYVGFDRFIKRKVPAWQSIVEIIIAFLVTVVVVRVIAHYVYAYLVYDGKMAEINSWDIRNAFRVFVFIGCSSGMALAFKFLRDQVSSKDRENKWVREKLSTELKMLRNQLHPHFLFNTLNNIYALTRKKSEQAPEAVMKLSELLSFILYESGRDTIALKKEIEFLEDYIALEKIRYSDRLTIHFSKDIANEDAQIAPLLLLPLVENAFKHGISESRFDSYISIAISQQNEKFSFSIENTSETEKQDISTGKIGLVNIQRQLELMYADHNITIDHLQNVYKVTLLINLDSYGKV